MVAPETTLLLHLRDGLDQIKDTTGRHAANGVDLRKFSV